MLRRVGWIFVLVIFLGALPPDSFADDIVQVQVSGIAYTAAVCSSDCTETINISFEFDDTLTPGLYGQPIGVVPGTMAVNASGFLGSFVWGGDAFNPDGYVAFYGSYSSSLPCAYTSCDELDLESSSWVNGLAFAPGTGAAAPYMFSCTSPECRAAYPDSGVPLRYYQPASALGTMTVTQVPEPSTLLLLAMGFLGLVAAIRGRGRGTGPGDKKGSPAFATDSGMQATP